LPELSELQYECAFGLKTIWLLKQKFEATKTNKLYLFFAELANRQHIQKHMIILLLFVENVLDSRQRWAFRISRDCSVYP